MDSLDAIRPPVTEEALAAAREAWSGGMPASFPLVIGAMFLSFAGIAAAVLAFLLRGGGALRLTGIEVQTAEGARASRARCLARTALGWSPFILFGAAAMSGHPGVGAVAAISVSLLGIAYSLRAPQQGIHDLIAGTYLIPR